MFDKRHCYFLMLQINSWFQLKIPIVWFDCSRYSSFSSEQTYTILHIKLTYSATVVEWDTNWQCSNIHLNIPNQIDFALREYYKSSICIKHFVRTTNSPYFRVLILFELRHECHILHVLKLCPNSRRAWAIIIWYFLCRSWNYWSSYTFSATILELF